MTKFGMEMRYLYCWIKHQGIIKWRKFNVEIGFQKKILKACVANRDWSFLFT